jgi:tRNA 5-methylaminomethyl-2-thiouridine biosynthesis bifunctional protein
MASATDTPAHRPLEPAAPALARRGWDVAVVDAADHAAAGASGNPAGILMPHLSAEHGVVSRFTLQAAEFARDWIESLAMPPDVLPRDWCGALWLADGERLARRLERIAARLPLPRDLVEALDPVKRIQNSRFKIQGETPPPFES